MNDHQLRYFALRLLRLFCPEYLYEEIEGDLIEKFNKDLNPSDRLNRSGAYWRKRAKRRLLWNVIKFIRLEIILRNQFKINRSLMLTNYVKTSLRHVRKSKVNFMFKLGGLTLALFSLLTIILYVSYQWSFDRFHQDYENIYRVNSLRQEEGKEVPYAMLPPAIGPALKQEFPEVLAYARWGVPGNTTIRYNDKIFRLPKLVEADSTVFDILSFSFLLGDRTALQQPNSIVLTSSVARQLFGDENPIGKNIALTENGNREMNVTGVVDDLPSNSHLSIGAIASFGSLFGESSTDSWKISWDGSLHLFVKLKSSANADELSRKALPLLRKNLTRLEDSSEKGFSIYLQPIADIYLDNALKMEFTKKGNSIYVYLFSLLGVFLLVIACINYVNLSVADFDTRAREMGVRKVLGARKTQIGFQIAFETLIISLISLVIAVIFIYLLFPLIASTLDTGLRIEMLKQSNIIFLTAAIVFLIVIFSSAYPSYRLMIQNSVQEMKSNSLFGSNQGVSKTLLLVQCVISIVCICATMIIGKQLSFIREKDVGYNRCGVVSLIMPDEYPPDRVSVLRNEMSHLAGVTSVSYSYYLMPIATYFRGWYQIEREGRMEKTLINEMFVDHDYFETMGIQLVSGRTFDRNHVTDANTAFVINETAAGEFGWTDPIGKRIKVGYDDKTDKLNEGTVIGVVKDFNTLSLHKRIEPVVMRLQYDSWPGNSLNVRVSAPVSSMLPAITTAYERVMEGNLADIRVLEDLFAKQYHEEDKAFASLQLATLIIIIISLLGIFSLSLSLSIKRTKEFGIRKILGATVREIATLHLSYFIQIIVMANLIALPMAWWFAKEWLGDFAYRTDISIIIFIAVVLISLLMVILSGGYSAWKAGRMNPIEAIRIQ